MKLIRKGVILLGLLFATFTFCALPVNAASRVQPTNDKIVVVIDPGHGGENEGTIENGFLEKSMDLITAQAMYDELCQYDDVEVYMTRTEDVDMTLRERAEFAASVNADFLFSIHYNASVKHDLFGAEVWISAFEPFNAYGYQFGYQHQLIMQDMGLSLRGVKTKLNDKEKDYYGIIREATALSVPAVIIEHCHVDEDRDYPFCDTEEEQIAFGKADALSVAKYFGLKSTALGVDYSENHELPDAAADELVPSTLQDETPPDICQIEITDTREDEGVILLNVTANDSESPLLYYDYSYDGGRTYSPLQLWPESNVLNGTYQENFTVTIEIPSGVQPDIILRAYNMFDAFTESNRITILETFLYGEDAVTEEAVEVAAEPVVQIAGEEDSQPASEHTGFIQSILGQTDTGEVSFFQFLSICLFLVIILFVLLLPIRSAVYRRHRRNRKKRR